MPISVQCKRCAHLINDWCKPKKDSPDPDILRICQFFREATNADRIRAMTDEELADWLSKTRAMWECRPKADKVRRGRCDADECYKCWLDWLQSPAERGDNDA